MQLTDRIHMGKDEVYTRKQCDDVKEGAQMNKPSE